MTQGQHVNTPVFFDSFSGGVANLKPRKKRNLVCVLKALSIDSKVSTWDMGENRLWVTVNTLEYLGLIQDEKSAYPWHKYSITEDGKNLLHKFDCGATNKDVAEYLYGTNRA